MKTIFGVDGACYIGSYIGIFSDDYPTADGTCVRDYIYVCDLAEAHLLVLEHLEKSDESGIFNLSSGGYSVKEIIETTRRITGEEIPTKMESRHTGDPSVLVASNQKAAKVLRWMPKRGLEEIIADLAPGAAVIRTGIRNTRFNK